LAFFLPIGFAVFLSLTIAKKERDFHLNLEAERGERDNVQELYDEEAATRKRLELALERSQELTLMAIEAAGIGVLDWDLATGKQVWSDIRKELFGFSKNCATDLDTAINAIHSDDRAKVRTAIADAILQQRNYCIEYRVVWPDGSVHWLWCKGRVLGDAAGNATRLTGVTMNIDDRKQAEEAARSKSALLEAQVNSTIDGILVVDAQGRVMLRNKRFVELFKIPQALVERDDDRLMLQYVTGNIIKNPEQFLEGVQYLYDHPNETEQDEFELKDGLVIDRYSSPVVGEDGRYYGRIWTFRDITERRRAEEEVRASRQMLQSILDAIPQRVFWKDKDSVFLGCNRPFAADAGLDSPAAVIGKNDYDLPSADMAEQYRADDQEVMEQRTAKLNFHERMTRSDGSELWLQTNKMPLFDLHGEVAGVIGTYEDITERKRAETEFRLTQFSLEHASDAVEWIDPEARIVYVNQAECRALERSREEMLGLSIPDIDPLFSEEVWKPFWIKLKTKGSMTFETQHKSKAGRIFPVEVTATYLNFDGNEYCFAFARDISERRELEAHLRQAQKLEAIGQLAAGIAHEINTPAQYVGDNTTFLRDSWASIVPLFEAMRQMRAAAANASLSNAILEEFDRRWEAADIEYLQGEIPKAIEQSLDGIQRVTKIVRAMKEFSHPGPEEKQAIDINKAIETTVTVARNEWKYVAEVETLLEPSLPPFPCHVGEFNQVILNLLVNSAHAIQQLVGDGSKGKGKITIRSRRDKDGIELAISDTGAGIPLEAQPRIFEPFFTTKPVGKGTGQGLALAHNTIVKRHGGRIWFETTPNKGTTFFIRLPFSGSGSEASS
jgi:PAS domain S-box-containing protein